MAGAHGSFINAGYALAGWIGYVDVSFYSLLSHKLSIVIRTVLTKIRFGCFNASRSSFGWRFPNAVLIILAIPILIGTFFGLCFPFPFSSIQ